MPIHHLHSGNRGHDGPSFKDFNWKSPTGIIIITALAVVLASSCIAPVLGFASQLFRMFFIK